MHHRQRQEIPLFLMNAPNLYINNRRACDEWKYVKYCQIFEIFQIWKYKMYVIFHYNISCIWRIWNISNIWTFDDIFQTSVVKITSETTTRCPKYRQNIPKINEIFQIFEIWSILSIFVKYVQITSYLTRRKPFVNNIELRNCNAFLSFTFVV